MTSSSPNGRDTRHEVLFGDRIIRCYAHRPANIDAMIRETVALHGDREAFRDEIGGLTYRAFDAALDNVAANLAVDGIGEGDRVGVFCTNSLDFVTALFGIIRRGAVAVPIGTRQQGDEIAYIAQDCGMIALIADGALLDRLPELIDTPNIRRRYAVGVVPQGMASFAQLREEPPASRFTAPDAREDALALIMYTSGTTGRPKGAMLAHANAVHSAMHFEACVGHTEVTRGLLAIPGSHISGLGAIIFALLRVGGSTVLMPEFKTRACLELMAREKISFTVFVPTMYKLLLLDPEFERFGLAENWRVGLFGGAIMPPAVIDELAVKLPDLELINAYGATETCSPATITRPGDAAAYPDAIGHVVPCGDVRIMDETGVELAPGTPGELWIGGPMVAKGYWANPEGTAASFVAGYWRSGDIGSIDADGRVRILDRKKDMINRAGYKIYSAEVENTLSQHPAVLESVVVPRPDAIFGERVQAFVHALPGVTADDLKRFVGERLADYKVPEYISLSETPLPRNNNGKLMKALLRDQVRTDAAADEGRAGRR